MKKEKELGLDSAGVQKVMHRKDYLADFVGFLGLALMGNIVGQLSYFYTDKVYVAVGAVGVMMGVAKVIDAFTDLLAGHMIDHSKGGNSKYYAWMKRMTIPAGIIMVLLFTVPAAVGNGVKAAYVLITNVLLSAVIYTFVSTPMSAVMVVRTKSVEERGKMGIFRAIASYMAGMITVLVTIPLTNALGGTQSAWIEYGILLGLVIMLCFFICFRNGFKAKIFAEEKEEEEPVAFGKAAGMLFHNKYWVIVLLFNLITQITNTISQSSATYYAKWIFGNDNLVTLAGAFGMLGTVIGFFASAPIIKNLGTKWTIIWSLLAAALFAGIRCFAPSNFVLYIITSMLGSAAQIPMMCLYGVVLSQAVDYNDLIYGKKLVAMSSGSIGFGNKVGGGIGTVVLMGLLALGGYNSKLAVATEGMKMSIYAFSNWLPIIINVIMALIFLKFDVEEKLKEARANEEQA